MLPFLLKPYLRKVIWGGTALSRFKRLPASLDHIGESWEVSAMPGHESTVASGEMTGLTLGDVCREHGRELLGDDLYKLTGGEFPLLVKFIDAADDLSVQVHPGDAMAARLHNSHGKCEMWYILATEPGSRLGAGLRDSLTPETLAASVADGSVTDHLSWYETHPGDVFYLPAGHVHSIGAGNLLLEVQQPSDITYRIYDYDRRDADGSPRELHIDRATEAIDYNPASNCRVDYQGDNLLDVEHFKVKRLVLEADAPATLQGTLTAVMCIDGTATATFEGGSLTIGRGNTMLVPANAKVVLRGPATVVTVTP